MSFSFVLNSYILHSPSCQELDAWRLKLDAWCLPLGARLVSHDPLPGGKQTKGPELARFAKRYLSSFPLSH